MKFSLKETGNKCDIVISELEQGFASAYGNFIRTAVYKYSECYKVIAVILNDGQHMSQFSVFDGVVDDALEVMLKLEDTKFISRSGAEVFTLEATSELGGKITAGMLAKSNPDATLGSDPATVICSCVNGARFSIKVVVALASGSNTERVNGEIVMRNFPALLGKSILVPTNHDDMKMTHFNVIDNDLLETLEISFESYKPGTGGYIGNLLKMYLGNLSELTDRFKSEGVV